jgi:hypothetical protein
MDEPIAPKRGDYSKAFENFVSTEGGNDDVVGLVAYALYKQGIREETLRSGQPPSPIQRDPSQTMVKTYRAAAEQSLTKIVQIAIEESTPDIQRSSVLSALSAAVVEIKGHMTSRTEFGYALLTNIFAWIITLAAATLILILAGRPAVEETLANATARVTGSATNSQ